MGTYTGLRGWVEFKAQYQENIRDITDFGFSWPEMFAELAKKEPAVAEFIYKPRSAWIPRGAACGMPESWGFGYANLVTPTKLVFACALKNYSGEIQAFTAMMPVVATAWELETQEAQDIQGF